MPRLAYLVFGWISVTLGVIGIFLPLLPTTVFLILAAFCFGRASPGARDWLLTHRLLGPPIRKWEATGAISASSKALAVTAMAASLAVTWLLALPGWVMAVQALCLAGAAAYVLTRPS